MRSIRAILGHAIAGINRMKEQMKEPYVESLHFILELTRLAWSAT